MEACLYRAAKYKYCTALRLEFFLLLAACARVAPQVAQACANPAKRGALVKPARIQNKPSDCSHRRSEEEEKEEE